MEHINVRGLPEPVARALESMVETLRRQMAGSPAETQRRTTANGTLQLDHRPGTVTGRLSREELYDDVA